MSSAQAIEARKKEFEDAALPYIDALYRGALKMTSNETLAEDLVQDTYLRAYQFFDKFNKGTNAKAWLFKILKNLYIDKYRVALRTPEMVAISGAELSGKLTAATTPENEIFNKLLDDEITRAMAALPEQFRLPVILSDLEGFSYRETADILDCPLGTVVSRLYRGRKFLRNSLFEYAKKRGYVNLKGNLDKDPLSE